MLKTCVLLKARVNLDFIVKALYANLFLLPKIFFFDLLKQKYCKFVCQKLRQYDMHAFPGQWPNRTIVD